MKPLRQLCATAVLTFALAFSSFAGTIDCGAVPPPPNPPASITGEIATGIKVANERSSTGAAFVDPVTELALNILQSMLSLF